MKFFIDNNLGEQLAAGMKAFGEQVMHLKDEFPQETTDTEWLSYVGKNNLVVVTRDTNVRRNPLELKTIREYKVGVFFLGGKNRSRCELIQQLVRNWPRMKNIANTTKKPFAFIVPPNGTKFSSVPL